MYVHERGKKPDTFMIDAFDYIVESGKYENINMAFGSFENMLVNIGLTPVPFREGKYFEQWISDENPNSEQISKAREIVGGFIDFRKTRFEIVIDLADKKGVAKEIGELVTQANADMAIRTNPLNTKKGRISRIKLLLNHGDKNAAREIGQGILDKYGINVHSIRIGQELEEDYLDTL